MPFGDLRAGIEALLPTIRQSADVADAAGRMGPDLVDQLKATGVFSATVPRSLGGLELSPRELSETIEVISAEHGSTGWCVMIAATTGLLAGYVDPTAGKEIFVGNVTGGAYAPTGTAKPLREGVLSVSGRWQWASGSQNCDWLLGGTMVVDDRGGVALDELGLPQMRLAFVPADQVQIVENWNVLGLRGTGSHDLVMTSVEVPLARTVSLLSDKPWAEGPLYLFPPFAALSLGVASVSLGIASAALEAFKDLAGSKTPTMATRSLGGRSTVRAELARCEAALAAARALHYGEIDSCWAKAEKLAQSPVESRDGFSGVERARLRMAFTHAAETSADVCARLHRLAGGTSVREGETLERAFRDSHTATQHILVGPQLHESIGAVLLGQEPGFNEL